jgi:hypothetical protein
MKSEKRDLGALAAQLDTRFGGQLTQARLAVLIRIVVPKFFLTDWPASEARD